MKNLEEIMKIQDAQKGAALARLFEFLRIASISTQSSYTKNCLEAAEWLIAQCMSIGFDVKLHEVPGAHPIVLAHYKKPGARSLLFYGHYDVQPVDPIELWDSPPFEPKLLEHDDVERTKIFGRGASDDKGQVMTFIEACRIWKETTGELPCQMTLLIEGAEETGSVGLVDWMIANRDQFDAEIALVCDTAMWNAQTPTVTTSLRGMLYYELAITCANTDLHSGFFGGVAPNPLHVLSKIIADMHDARGLITLPGFYDGIIEPSEEDRALWAKLAVNETEYLAHIGLTKAFGEVDRNYIEKMQSRPSFDVNGLIGGYTEEGSKTVIPSSAQVKLSFRLVDGQNIEAIHKAFEQYVQKRVPEGCHYVLTCSKAYAGITVPTTLNDLNLAREALKAEWDAEPLNIGSGGSIPAVKLFREVLGIETLLIGFGLDEDCIHAPNETYALKSFYKGTRSWIRIIGALGETQER